MKAYWPVFAVLSVTWLAFIASLLAAGRRSARVEGMLSGSEVAR